MDSRQGGTTMRGKRLSERTMSHAKLEMVVDYYLADMQRRGCTQDSVTTNRKALRQFDAPFARMAGRRSSLNLTIVWLRAPVDFRWFANQPIPRVQDQHDEVLLLEVLHSGDEDRRRVVGRADHGRVLVHLRPKPAP